MLKRTWWPLSFKSIPIWRSSVCLLDCNLPRFSLCVFIKMDAWTASIRNEFWLTQGEKWSHWKNNVLAERTKDKAERTGLLISRKQESPGRFQRQEIWKTVCSFFPPVTNTRMKQPVATKFLLICYSPQSLSFQERACKWPRLGHMRAYWIFRILKGKTGRKDPPWSLSAFAVCWYSSFLFKIMMVKWELAFIGNAIITIILMENHIFKNFPFPYCQNVLSHLFILIVIHRYKKNRRYKNKDALIYHPTNISNSKGKLMSPREIMWLLEGGMVVGWSEMSTHSRHLVTISWKKWKNEWADERLNEWLWKRCVILISFYSFPM